jgi:hypothetical protein
VTAPEPALVGAVSSTGGLSLLSAGHPVTRVAAGHYTLTIVDKGKTTGFVLEEVGHTPISVTGAPFVGKRSISVDLTAGRWLYGTASGRLEHTLTVT